MAWLAHLNHEPISSPNVYLRTAFLANLVFKHRSLDRKTGFEQKVAKTAKIRRAKTPLAFFVLLSEKFSSAARIFAAKEHKEHKEKCCFGNSA